MLYIARILVNVNEWNRGECWAVGNVPDEAALLRIVEPFLWSRRGGDFRKQFLPSAVEWLLPQRPQNHFAT